MDLRDARRWQTLSEAARLLGGVDQWVEKRRAAFAFPGQYETQLNLISAEVQNAAERVRSSATAGSTDARPQGELCDEYNLHDQRLVWIRYAWEYFKNKLDQRDDASLRDALEAADEVSWSCYSTFFKATNQNVRPAPLPYIEYDYVPSALRPGQRHVLNRKPEGEIGPLKAYFATLPVPLLRLPPAVVSAPWSLALIGHETGHLIQEYFEPDSHFFETFAAAVCSRVADNGGDGDTQAQWSRWSQEIFADLCLAVTAGPWAAWAVAPWVVTREASMDEPADLYPSPRERLHLIDGFSRAAGLPPASEIFTRDEFDLGNFPHADAVAQLATQTFAINGVHRTVCDALAGPPVLDPGGRIRQWSDELLGARAPLPERDRTASRNAAVAAVRAHYVALARGADLDALRPRVLALMRDCRVEGRRAGEGAIPPYTALSDALFDLPDEDLFGPRA